MRPFWHFSLLRFFMSEPTSRRPAYARLLDRAVRILAVRDHSEQDYGVTLRAGDGQNGPERLMRRQTIMNA